ncbi:DUF2029 domain-containing protein [Candidatus Woesearchaeota archaeon]|nr:DUF2029 domain-containing protein [Candidatus Woesearchaeota archaeon]
MDKKYSIILFVVLISAISFARSFLGLVGIIPWHYGYSDIFNNDRIGPDAWKIPYIENPVEYPVVTGFFIYSAWHIGKNLLGYAIYTWILLTIAAAATAVFLYKLLKLLNIEEKSIKNIFLYFIFAPSLLLFGVYNWDMIAVMFMVISIYYYFKKEYVVSSIFLGLGFNAKLFPVLALPFMLLKADFKARVKIVLAFAAVFLVLNMYFILNSFDTWKYIYTFHSSRAPNIDSIWHLMNLEAGTINLLSLLLLLFSYALLAYHHKKYSLISLSFASILLFLLFSKVVSPQYLLWTLPFFVLYRPMPSVFYLLESMNLAVFFLTVRWIFLSSKAAFILAQAAVFSRTLIVAYILYLVLCSRNSNNANNDVNSNNAEAT